MTFSLKISVRNFLFCIFATYFLLWLTENTLFMFLRAFSSTGANSKAAFIARYCLSCSLLYFNDVLHSDCSYTQTDSDTDTERDRVGGERVRERERCRDFQAAGQMEVYFSCPNDLFELRVFTLNQLAEAIEAQTNGHTTGTTCPCNCLQSSQSQPSATLLAGVYLRFYLAGVFGCGLRATENGNK